MVVLVVVLLTMPQQDQPLRLVKETMVELETILLPIQDLPVVVVEELALLVFQEHQPLLVVLV
jgi:hypothetical protein